MKSNSVGRQNSSPHLARPATSKIEASARSKTPPAKFTPPLPSENASKCKTLPRNISTTKKRPSPSECSSKSSSSQSSSMPDISKDVAMDIKYNLYCQANLIASYSKALKERNEAKMIQEVVNMETGLLEMDEKISALDTNIEKKLFYEKARFSLQEETRCFEKIINDVDEDKLDEYIRMLEQDLGNVQLKNFDLPKSEEEAKEILESIQEMNVTLEQITEVEKKVSPFSQLHSSWLEVKRNVQKEKDLEHKCAKDLKLAEKLVYDQCFQKSIDYLNISKDA